MAKTKTPAFSPEIPDGLLDGQDSAKVLRSAGLLGELIKALAEQILNADMDVHLDSDAEQAAGNHRNGSIEKTMLSEDVELMLSTSRDLPRSPRPFRCGPYPLEAWCPL